MHFVPFSAGGNGKYWCVEEDSSISASGSIPVDFFISLFDDAYFSLKTKGERIDNQKSRSTLDILTYPVLAFESKVKQTNDASLNMMIYH